MAARKPASSVKKIPPRRAAPARTRTERWWKQQGADLAHNVAAVVNEIEKRQSTRRSLWARYLGLYLDIRLSRESSQWADIWRLTPNSANAKRCTYNVVQANIDTAGAHLNRQRPRPLYLTSGGDYSLQLQAKKLTRFMDGLFAMLKIHKTGQMVARDSRIFGTGVGYFYTDLRRDPDDPSKIIDGEIKVDRVMVDELFVDDEEARYGLPRQLFRKRQVSRDELIDLFPECAADIEAAQAAKYTRDDADIVEVRESWHLPTGTVWWRKDGEKTRERSKGAEPVTDGVYAISIDGVTLHQRPYVYDYFPFLPLHWTDPAAGFWGRGIAEELSGIQQAITNLRRDIDAGQKLLGKAIIFVEEGSSVADITDEVGQVVKYIGQRPTAQVIQAVSPEIYEQIDRDYRMSFELTGVSHANATGQKPAGVESAVAIREVNDTSSARFVDKAQAFEQWFLDGARICIDLARELYDEHGVDLLVKGRAQKFIESIPWSEVNLKDSMYDMQVFPVSLLPTTPQGRLQTVMDMLNAGMITSTQAKQLMEMPDLDAYPSVEAAAFEYACGVVADILEGEDYPGIDTRAPLSMLRDVALANYLRALREKVPEPILERLRQLMDEAQMYLSMIDAGMDPANPQDLQAFMANGGKPPAPPAPMPAGSPTPLPPGAPPPMPPPDEQPPMAA